MAERGDCISGRILTGEAPGTFVQRARGERLASTIARALAEEA